MLRNSCVTASDRDFTQTLCEKSAVTRLLGSPNSHLFGGARSSVPLSLPQIKLGPCIPALIAADLSCTSTFHSPWVFTCFARAHLDVKTELYLSLLLLSTLKSGSRVMIQPILGGFRHAQQRENCCYWHLELYSYDNFKYFKIHKKDINAAKM